MLCFLGVTQLVGALRNKKQFSILHWSRISSCCYHRNWIQLVAKPTLWTSCPMSLYSNNLLQQCGRHICVCQSCISFLHETHCHWFSFCSWSSVQEVATCLSYSYFWPTRWLSHKAPTSPSVFKSSLQDWHPWWKLNLVRAWKENPLTLTYIFLVANTTHILCQCPTNLGCNIHILYQSPMILDCNLQLTHLL